MTSAEDTPARLARIEAMLQTLLERTPAPRPKAAPGPDRSAEVDAFVAMWNRECGGLPQAEAAPPGSTRYRNILACLSVNPNMSAWAAAVRALAKNRWNRGENDRGWVAKIDYLIRPSKRLELLEDGRRGSATIPTAVVPRVVRCVKCGAQATVGPGTGQAQLSPEALCPGCFGGK